MGGRIGGWGGGGGSDGFHWEDQSALAEYKGVRL